MKILPAAAFLLALAGCSTGAKRVEIHSDPLGAEVRTPKGEILGLTPLVLEGEMLKHASPDGKQLSVEIDSMGFVAGSYTFQIQGEDKHEVKLKAVDEVAFREGVLFQYTHEVNHMVRDLMSIQGMIIAKKLDDAERALQDFHKRFPNVAASYVMAANLAIVRGELETAHGYLLKARSIDPNDAVVHQMLAGLASYGAKKYEAVSEGEHDAVDEDPNRNPADDQGDDEGDGGGDNGSQAAGSQPPPPQPAQPGTQPAAGASGGDSGQAQPGGTQEDGF